MRKRLLALVLFTSGILFTGISCANDEVLINAGNLDDDLDYYRSACIMPYYGEKEQNAVYDEMISKGVAEPLLTRLAIGAPPNWKPIADNSVAIKMRLESAVNLIGMAISHGSAYEKKVAKAYSVLYFPVPRSDECTIPDGVAEFVKQNDFWQAP